MAIIAQLQRALLTCRHFPFACWKGEGGEEEKGERRERSIQLYTQGKSNSTSILVHRADCFCYGPSVPSMEKGTLNDSPLTTTRDKVPYYPLPSLSLSPLNWITRPVWVQTNSQSLPPAFPLSPFFPVDAPYGISLPFQWSQPSQGHHHPSHSFVLKKMHDFLVTNVRNEASSFLP